MQTSLVHSAMELLDFVDEHDVVQGQASRDEIHRQSLMHRACHMLLFNTAGEVFVQKRSSHKDNDPGLWDSSAAGHVDAGECYIDCAVRELEEELGLQVGREELVEVFKLPPVPATGMEFARVYTLVSDSVLRLDPIEIDAGLWLAPAALSGWIDTQPEVITVALRKIWAQLKKV